MVALTSTSNNQQHPSYSVTFKNDLYEAERVRKQILLNYSIVGSVLFIGLIIEAVTWMSIALLVIAVFVLVYTYWFGIPVSKYETMYLHAVTNHALQKNRGLSVDYGSHLRASELKQSKWLIQDPDYFGGKHLLHGSIHGVDVRISEVYYTSKPAVGLCNASGIFNGIILCATVPSKEAASWILSTDERMYVSDAASIQVTMAKSVITDSNYATEIQHLAATMVNFSSETGIPVIGSYVAGQFSLALQLPEGFQYFKPKITSSVFNMEPVQRYDRDLQFLIDASTLFAAGLENKG